VTPRTAVRLEIEGRVQGVGFRWWTVRQARALGLSGWVRNRRDGAVEVLAIGEPEAIDQLERLCRQGPSAARVSSVRRTPALDDGAQDFEERASD
jgi:acylphosphatase